MDVSKGTEDTDFRVLDKEDIIHVPSKEPRREEKDNAAANIIRSLNNMEQPISATSETEPEEGSERETKSPRRTKRTRHLRNRDEYM